MCACMNKTHSVHMQVCERQLNGSVRVCVCVFCRLSLCQKVQVSTTLQHSRSGGHQGSEFKTRKSHYVVH